MDSRFVDFENTGFPATLTALRIWQGSTFWGLIIHKQGVAKQIFHKDVDGHFSGESISRGSTVYGLFEYMSAIV